ncbi:SpcZ [Streptomyces sp. NPDC052496]|uniref:SpcZ n=1 Tax=Streptomyces sp. NPDC052496 TaxID=3154951 RepID=UPI003423334D
MSWSPVAAEAYSCFRAHVEAGGAGGTGGADGTGAGGDGPGADGTDAPAWLVQTAAALFDGQGAEAAESWARRVFEQVARLEGRIPLSVVHDWQVRTVLPVLEAASVRRGGTGAELEAVRGLHERALAGGRATEGEWAAALEPALREVYRLAYAYADAFATAAANARAYAAANDYGEQKTAEFAEYYAKLNTGANARSFADAHALANSRALAAAYAGADARAYTEAYPGAYVHAYALAEANREVADGQEDERRRAAYGRLAEGLADSLARAAVA